MMIAVLAVEKENGVSQTIAVEVPSDNLKDPIRADPATSPIVPPVACITAEPREARIAARVVCDAAPVGNGCAAPFGDKETVVALSPATGVVEPG
jgi:hypothetical protein